MPVDGAKEHRQLGLRMSKDFMLKQTEQSKGEFDDDFPAFEEKEGPEALQYMEG